MFIVFSCNNNFFTNTNALKINNNISGKQHCSVYDVISHLCDYFYCFLSPVNLVMTFFVLCIFIALPVVMCFKCQFSALSPFAQYPADTHCHFIPVLCADLFKLKPVELSLSWEDSCVCVFARSGNLHCSNGSNNTKWGHTTAEEQLHLLYFLPLLPCT
mgnify:CR=1 FL=1